MKTKTISQTSAPGEGGGEVAVSGAIESKPGTHHGDSLPSDVQTAVDAAVNPDFASKIEAVLMSADRPTPPERIAEALGLIARFDSVDGGENPASQSSTKSKLDEAARIDALGRITQGVTWLNEEYTRTGRSFRIEAIAGGLRIMTRPEFVGVIAEFQRARLSAKLSRPAIETLAIIAYKQPLTRAQLEAIRGVSCGEVLRTLVDRKLVTVKGRAEELGRPLLYGTTKPFLDLFGLSSVRDLPTLAELRPA